MPPENSRPIWITGSGGLIGSHLAATAARLAPSPATPAGPSRVRALTRADLDLLDAAAVRAAFELDRPEILIHCAALSKSPACQADPAAARRINVEVTRQLADLAADAMMIFFSSDLVFDGRDGFYDERAAVNPLSVYGETKVEAERIVLAHPRHLVIRTSLNAGISPTGDRGFNEETRNAWAGGKTLSLFTDEFRCPIPARETARAVWDLIRVGASGIVHVAGSERLSRFDLGHALAARWPDVPARIQASTIREYRGAPRAPDTSLNCAKAEGLLGRPMPAFTRWLAANPDEPV